MRRLRRKALSSGVAAVTALVLTCNAGAQSSFPSRDGTALYDAAYDRWRALPEAPYATYDADFVATFRGRRQERAYAVAYRARDGQCLVTGTPLDARDRPDAPQVTDRCFGPDFAFTFVPQRRNARGASALGGGVPLDIPTPEPAPSDEPRTIGRVSVRVRPYAISIAGDETIGATATVHLRLRPLRDPAKFILRDLWVDRATDGVVRLGAEVEAGVNLAHVAFVATYAEDAKTQTLQTVSGYVKAQLLLVKGGARRRLLAEVVRLPRRAAGLVLRRARLSRAPRGVACAASDIERLVTVATPYRLDLTAAVLRRFSTNIVDVVRSDGAYVRALAGLGAPAIVSVRQPEAAALAVEIVAAPGDEARVLALVQRMLGTQRNRCPVRPVRAKDPMVAGAR